MVDVSRFGRDKVTACMIRIGQGKGDGKTPENHIYTAIEWLPGREALEFPSCSPDKAHGPVTRCWTGIFPILGLDGPGFPYHEFGHG